MHVEQPVYVHLAINFFGTGSSFGTKVTGTIVERGVTYREHFGENYLEFELGPKLLSVGANYWEINWVIR